MNKKILSLVLSGMLLLGSGLSAECFAGPHHRGPAQHKQIKQRPQPNHHQKNIKRGHNSNHNQRFDKKNNHKKHIKTYQKQHQKQNLKNNKRHQNNMRNHHRYNDRNARRR